MSDLGGEHNDVRKDRLSKEQRSALMAKVKSKDTKPEELVRKALFKAGFRYRKNVPNLPGKPDIVLSKYKTIIFIHGCFWHQHPNCSEATIPYTRPEYWIPKLQRNIERDRQNCECLEQAGWRVIIVWECELRPRVFKAKIDNLIMQLRRMPTKE